MGRQETLDPLVRCPACKRLVNTFVNGYRCPDCADRTLPPLSPALRR